MKIDKSSQTRIGHRITLGAYDDASEPVMLAASLQLIENAWLGAFDPARVIRRPDEPQAGIVYVPRGTEVEIVGQEEPAGLKVRCSRVKVLSGDFAGTYGWIATPRRLDPPTVEKSLVVGECLLIAGSVAGDPSGLDDLLDADVRPDVRRAVETLAMLGIIHVPEADLTGRVVRFGTTPRRGVSCAQLEFLVDGEPCRSGWILASEANDGR